MIINLPSNASMHIYPNNTLQNYKTEVAITEEFIGNWEIGLASITFPRMWYNVTEEDSECSVMFENNTIRPASSIPIGRYSTMEQLIKALNNALNSTIPDGLNRFALRYDPLTRKVTYDMDSVNHTTFVDHPKVAAISLSNGIANILGFRCESCFKDNMIIHKHPFTGNSVADLNKGIHSLYVYSNVIEPCPVGDSRVPLLRVVPLTDTSENSSLTMQCTKSFSRIHYHPLRHKRITTIEIDIKDCYGRPVPFERGELLVTLHLRKAKPLF